MKVERFEKVGPILGYVSPSGARVFGRARFDREKEEGTPKRRFGVVRVREKTGTYAAPRFFKMLPHFDFTGVGIVGGLSEGTEHEYQAGWIFSEGELPNPLHGDGLEWDDVLPRSFTTASADPEAPRSFVFGSCRYLLRIFGGTIFEGRGDKTFRSIVEQKEDMGVRTDALIMLGDQIYADDLNFISPDKQVDEFLDRYREAFGQKHLRRLMSSVPTYMTLDDHEIEDNWPHKASERDFQVKYPAAMHAYSIYQMSHSPLPELNAAGDALARMANRFWYTFSDGCCDFFVLDVRTERLDHAEIIGPDQMAALKNWLGDGKKKVKVIVSSVPVFPDFRSPSDDKWSGFQAQRDELLNFIHDKRVRRVVTISGDVHSSMSVELRSVSDKRFRVVSVVSSPFYWPYPHPNRKSFQMEGHLRSSSPYDYRLANGSGVVTTDNFTRLTVDLRSVTVETFGRKGDSIGVPRVHRF